MEWNIQARAHVCQSCERRFADKECFHTLLYEVKGGYERLDVCQGCWEGQFSQGATERKGFVSYWQSVYSVPPPAPPEPIQRESAEGLLRRLMELNDPKYGAALYILGAMLERKRILKVKAQLARDGQRVFVYEHGKSGDLFHIPDPNLRLDELEAVQVEVLGLLEHGLGAGGNDKGQGTNDEGSEGAGDGGQASLEGGGPEGGRRAEDGGRKTVDGVGDSRSQIADSRGEEGADGGRASLERGGPEGGRGTGDGVGDSRSQIADSRGEEGADGGRASLEGGGPEGGRGTGDGGRKTVDGVGDSRSQIADGRGEEGAVVGDGKGKERVNVD